MTEPRRTDQRTDQDEWRPAGGLVVGLLALAWLVIDLGIAIKTVGAGMIATTQVAMFLPSITASSLAAGAGLGVS